MANISFNFSRGSGSGAPKLDLGPRFWKLLLWNRVQMLAERDPYQDPANSKWLFKDHYQKFVLPHVQNFETMRTQALADYRGRMIKALPMMTAVILCAVMYFINKEGISDADQFVFGLSFMALTLIYYWARMPVRKYRKEVKAKVFPYIFNFFGETFKYQQTCPFGIDTLEPSGLIPQYTEEYKEDYIRGKYKGVGLKLFEATLKKTTGSGKNRRTVTVFRGMFLLLDMNKKFKGKTVVRRDAGRVINWLKSKFTAKNMQAITLEDPLFEDQFDVSATDQVEARYLLTTSFMDRLTKLSDLFDKSQIECSFYENKVLFKIPSSKNRFEVSSIYIPATFESDIHGILREMAVIFEMIELLKLNEQTRL